MSPHIQLGQLLGVASAALAPSVAAQPAPSARADAPALGSEARPATSLAGKWQAEPMTVRWVIGSWGEACGPRPSGGGDPGGVVTLEEQGGELVFELGEERIDRWKLETGDFVKAIREGGPAPIPAEQVIWTNVIMDGIYRSAKEGREVAVGLPSD